MRVLFANRSRGSFWSIEELFDAIAEACPSWVKVTQSFAPQKRANVASLLANVRWLRALRKFDVIHQTGDIHYSILGVRRCPVVLTIHDLRFVDEAKGLKRFLFWLLWLYLPCLRADRVTVISEFTKDRLLKLCRIRREKIAVIPNCVGSEFHSKEKLWNSECPVILHIGTTPNKNLERLSAACAGLNVRLWILGHVTPEQRQTLTSHKNDFKEFSNLSRTEVVGLYEQCDLVSFVSTYEGFGLPIIEAQAVGRPVLTSDISPTREVAGGGALLVDPFDVHAIRCGLLRLLNEPALRNDLVKNGFLNVRNYSAESVAAQYAALYEEVLASR